MQIINHVLVYSENELKGKSFTDEEIQKIIPKGKYYDVRKIEDIAYTIEGTINEKGEEYEARRKMITIPNIVNRAERRYRKKHNVRFKSYNLRSLHKRFAKRRRKKGYGGYEKKLSLPTVNNWIKNRIKQGYEVKEIKEMFERCRHDCNSGISKMNFNKKIKVIINE